MINPLSIVLAIGCLILAGFSVWMLYKYNQAEKKHQDEMDKAELKIAEARTDNQRVLEEAEELSNCVSDVALALLEFITNPSPATLIGFEVDWDGLPDELKEELASINEFVHAQELKN
jgi:hypothetical protein